MIDPMAQSPSSSAVSPGLASEYCPAAALSSDDAATAATAAEASPNAAPTAAAPSSPMRLPVRLRWCSVRLPTRPSPRARPPRARTPQRRMTSFSRAQKQVPEGASEAASATAPSSPTAL